MIPNLAIQLLFLILVVSDHGVLTTNNFIGSQPWFHLISTLLDFFTLATLLGVILADLSGLLILGRSLTSLSWVVTQEGYLVPLFYTLNIDFGQG